MEDNNIKLLKFIKDNPAQSRADIYSRFELGADHRINSLLKLGFLKVIIIPNENLSRFSITEKGLICLQDAREQNINFIKKSILVPITISIVTTILVLVINYLWKMI